MKKLTFITCMMLAAFAVKAQKHVAFKFNYLPEHTYNVAAKSSMSAEVVTVNDSINTGQSAPRTPEEMHMKMSNDWVASIKTGERNTSLSIPAIITGNRISSSMNVNGQGGAFPVNNALTGQSIPATINAQGGLTADTLDDRFVNASQQVRMAFAFVICDMPHPIKFPGMKLKIGDTFTEDIVSNDMEIINIGFKKQFPVKYLYKLTDIKDNKAYFDTTSEGDTAYSIQDKGRTVIVKQRASGTGKTVFDISTGYPQAVTSNLKISLSAESGLKKMNAKFLRTVEAEVVVKAN